MDDKEIKDHYTNLFEAHGVSEKSVQYTDKYSQYARFFFLTQFIQKEASILDVGCGLGDLYTFLKSHDFSGSYHGVDIVPEFIDHCRVQFSGHSKANFSEILNNEEFSSESPFIWIFVRCKKNNLCLQTFSYNKESKFASGEHSFGSW